MRHIQLDSGYFVAAVGQVDTLQMRLLAYFYIILMILDVIVLSLLVSLQL